MWVSSYRSTRAGAAAPPPPSGYDLPTVIAAVRAADSEFTDTSDPFAPAGLALPIAPSGLTPVAVASLAALDAELASPNNKQITLASGVYNRASGPGFAIAGNATNWRVVLDGVTINTVGNNPAFTIHWSSTRGEVTGGAGGAVFSAVPWPQGRDIRLYNLYGPGDNLAANPDANSTGLGVCGHRVLWERCSFSGWNGLFFTGAIQGVDMDASISGTTLTVNTVYQGVLRVGATVVANGGGAISKGTKILSQLSGSAGGAGTYQLSISQTRASARASTYERSTNLIAANSELICLTNGSGGIENPVRFNGVNMGLIVDCRLVCDGKYTGRVHPDFGYVFGNGKVGFVRTQAEKYGINCAQLGGVTPGTELIVMDGVKVYRDVESTWSFDRLMGINATAVSGDGVTVTYDCEGDNGHGLVDGERVTTQGWTPSAFNQTNVMVNVVSPTRFQYMAIGAMGSASGGFAISQKDGIVLMRQRNCEVFSAPAIGTNGAALLPGGSGSPPSDWPTANNSTNAAAAGNFVRTQVAPPAWSRQ